ERCPVLAVCLETSKTGSLQCAIETSTKDIGISFLRHIYTGSYDANSSDNRLSRYIDIPVIMHVEMCLLGLNFDVPELCSLALSYFLDSLEVRGSTCSPPESLCATIQLIYQHPEDLAFFKKDLVSYCVTSAKSHKLAQDEAFRQVVFDLPEFWVDLGHLNSERNFADE
ncbi:hypothetical protein K402DRAFT_301215, partial [Aulographum hederae CBS 113979]